MAGKPAGRIGDKVAGGVIVEGSPTVLIGDLFEGLADKCSACQPVVGGPVNPMLGCKILPAETDFAFPAPSIFAFSRSYLSSDPRIGSLGQGWSIPGESLFIEVGEQALILTDPQGRRLSFSPLAAGEESYSLTEMFWLRRGARRPGEYERRHKPWKDHWAGIPLAWQQNEQSYFLSSQGRYVHFQFCKDRWRVTHLFDRNGYCTTFQWGGSGQVHSVCDSAGRLYAFAYDLRDAASAEDSCRRLRGIALAGGVGHGLELPKTFDPRSPDTDWLIRYDYDDEGNLRQVIDRHGQVLQRFAWRNHMMIEMKRPGGQTIRYEWDRYDPGGKVIRQIESDGLTREYRYHPACTDVIDSLGRRQRYHFGGEGGLKRWLALEQADDQEIEYGYDMYGRQVAVTDPLQRTTHTPRNAKGQIVGRTNAAGETYRFGLDEASGSVRDITDPDQHRTHIQHNDQGLPVAVVGSGGQITRYGYETPHLPDRPSQIIDADGRVKTLRWTPLGQLAAYTDCSGKTTRYDYDDEGKLLSMTDPAGSCVRYRYDDRHNLNRVELPDGQQIEYRHDRHGRRTHIRQGDAVTRLRWDERGRLTGLIDPAGHIQQYGYDVAGRLVRIVNENGTQARFEYDGMDRLIQETGFDGRTQQYRYNAAGELIERVEADGNATRYEYDLAGRLIARWLPATPHAPSRKEWFRWSPGGQLLYAASDQVVVEFAYDDSGRPVRESHTHPDDWFHDVHQRYDAGGNPAKTWYGAAPEIRWLTYGPGHVHGLLVDRLELSLQRDDRHREIQRSALWQGKPLFDVLRQYDESGRLHDWQLHRPDGQWHRQYRYDPQGQLQQIEDDRFSAIAYRYDPAGRLIGSRHGEQNHHYAFDPAGNPVPGLQLPQQREYPHDDIDNGDLSALQSRYLEQRPERWPDNRVTEHEGYICRYDAAGNLTHLTQPDGITLELHYDGAHRLMHLLKQREGQPILEAGYLYDPFSRRIAKIVRHADGTQKMIRYAWHGDKCCAVDDGETTRTIVYEPDGFVPLLQIEYPTLKETEERIQQKYRLLCQGISLPEALRMDSEAVNIALFHCDHLGTPLSLTDTKDRTLWQAEPDDWAAVKNERGETDQPIRFQGQFEDRESGLYYNRYRYYLPKFGRYITQDPIGLRGEMNVYSYTKNSIGSIDPFGLDTYIINRDLAVLGDSARSRYNILTHTFVATTNPDGSLANTYSWGNDANLKGWNFNQELDIKTAKEALNKGLGEKVSMPDDQCVLEAYNKLNTEENKHFNGFVYYNCKSEASKLVKEAKELCKKK